MDDLLQQDWDRQTFVHWAELVKTEPPERLGIEVRREGIYLLTVHTTNINPEMNPAVFYWYPATSDKQSRRHD